MRNIVELKFELFGTHRISLTLLPSSSVVETYFGYLAQKGSNRTEHQAYLLASGEG